MAIVKKYLYTFYICATFLFTGFVAQTSAQTVGLQAVQQQDGDGEWETKLLNKPDRALRFDFSPDLSAQNATLKIGTLSNTYTEQSIAVSGNRLEVVPNEIDLDPGRYYARITNSEQDRFSQIKSDAQENEGIVYSNEVQFIVEAQNAPKVIDPRGQIENPTPTFDWDPVQGVEAYWIIVSSTPFDIVTDENDEISIEGANMVWQFITSETSAQYGDINPNTPYQNEAPPLDPNKEYSYAVLNLYEEDNPVYASPVFGGVIPVTYVNENPIPKPELISPEENVSFDGKETITFRWTEVEEAVSYTVNLYEVVTLQGVDASTPLWSVTTTNTLVDYPALGSLKDSEYKWNVVANDEHGGGTTSGTSTSPTRQFSYEVPLGEFRALARSSLDGSEVVGVEVTMRAISGGVTPNTPTFLQSSSVSDSLVTGRYEFTAEKEGYRITTRQVEIKEDQTTRVPFDLEPLPASISGTVRDENGDPLENARIILESIESGESFSTESKGNGEFTLGVPNGNYALTVRKNGYIKQERSNISLGIDEQVSFETPFELVNDQATISGYVLNESDNPIRLAKVTITSQDDDEAQEIRTTGSGFYKATVSSGSWVLRAEKSGFVLSSPLRVKASVGENLQNKNLSMTGRANQVSGFAREIIINDDGGVGSAPLEDVEIRAVPSEGSVITTQSSRNGSFNLNLKSGSYTISANLENYSSSDPVEVSLGYGETLNGIEFELSPNPSSVSGRVVTSDGSGLGNVKITDTDDTDIQTTTSSGGYYNISLPVGSHRLKAQLSGYSSTRDHEINLSAGQDLGGLDFTLSPNAVVINGNVRSSKGSLAYSDVFAENDEGEVEKISADEFGDYEFSLSPDDWTVYAKKSGYTYSDSVLVQLDPGQERSDLDFILQPKHRNISGVVTGGGDALREARIQLLDLDTETEVKSTFSKVDGSFRLSAETDESYRVVIRKDGYQTNRVEIDPLEIATEDYTLDVTLQVSPAQIGGIVTDANEIPLKDAVISILDEQQNVVNKTRTNSSGAYSMGVEAGSYTVSITKPGYATKPFNVTLNLGEERNDVNSNLKKDFALYSGTITDQEGNPVNRVYVRLENQETGTNARSGSDGSYALTNVVAGTYNLTARKDGYETYRQSDIEISGGANISDDITLNKFDAKINGTARDLDGQTLNSTTVYSVDAEGNEFTTVTDDTGEYEFAALPPGNYNVYGLRSGYKTADTVNVELATPTDESNDNVVNLSRKNGIISGSVEDMDTGGSIRSVDIVASGPGSDRALTGSSGNFEITSLAQGAYQVIASKRGYASDTTEVELTAETLEQEVSFSLRKNIGSISGRVLNQNGNSLGQTITVRAVTAGSSDSYETRTDLNGSFSFSSIANGRTYAIETEALGKGLVNTERKVEFGSSELQLDISDEPLTVTQNTSSIRGNAEIYDAKVELLDSNGNTVELKRSEPDGSYLFRFLAEGNYRITAAAEGYIFSPDTQDVEVGFDSEATPGDFSAEENQGTFTINAETADQQPLEEVSVTVVSEDQSIRRSGTTNAEGTISFEELTASRTYNIFAKKTAYSLSDPDVLSQSYPLNAGDSRTLTIGFQRNEFNLYGIVARSDSNEGLEGEEVLLTATDGSLQQTTTTGGDGEYFFGDLPGKTFEIKVEAGSFEDGSAQFDIENLPRDPKTIDGEQKNVSMADSLKLDPAYVNIIGEVLYNESGVSGAEVQVQGTEEQTLQSNSNGRFRFDRYPVSFGSKDSVSLSIRVQYEGYEETKLVKISESRLGKNVLLDDYVIPSGQIDATIVSGTEVLPGIEIILDDPNTDKPLEFITNDDGKIVTNSTLRAGTYSISVNTDDYLLPTEPFEVNLTDNTSAVQDTLNLPYQFSPPGSIQAAYPTEITVQASEGEISNSKAAFFYKRKRDNEYSEITLQPATGAFQEELPALQSLESIEYYVEVQNNDNGMVYRSPRFTEELGAKDLVEEILFQPGLSELLLRTNDEYSAAISVKDGNNNIMSQAFAPDSTGVLEIAGSDDNLEAAIEANELTLMTPDEAGRYTFQVRARLDNQDITQEVVQTFNTVVKEVNVDEIEIQSFGNNTITNKEPFTFNYTAMDTSGTRVHLGNNLNWSVSPSHMGVIDNQGRFTPSSNSIGEFQVEVFDESSETSGRSETINMVAEIRPEDTMELNYGSSFSLKVDQNSFDSRTVVRMSQNTPESVKKFSTVITPEGSSGSYTSSDQLYSVTTSGGSLVKPATLTLKADRSLDLFEGERKVAYYNQEDLQWEVLESSPSKSKSKNGTPDSTITAQTENFGQFVILAQNEPLGLRHFAVLPTPFSPEVAPAKIGYLLTSQNPPVYVTMHIYNMRGQLVRTLLDKDDQMPGRYGSKSGEKVIEWDGLTDGGQMARNGRYLVKIVVEDGEEKKEYLKSLVLIK